MTAKYLRIPCKKMGGLVVRLVWLAVAVVSVLGLGSAVSAQEVPAPDPLEPPAAAKPYAAKGAEACLKCHDKAPATNILHGAHAMKGDDRTPFAKHFCETCHGASPEHAFNPEAGAKNRPPPSVTFGANSLNSPDEQNKVCLTCHQGGLRMNWKGSQHQSSDTRCVSCHDMHTTRDPMLSKQDQPGVCFTCHLEQRAQVNRPSHHPIREGKVVCSECHNPHGSPTDKLLKGITVNDTCFNCHAEKRGPMLWEHEPVREDCTNCHTPHGSTQRPLLKARAPWLCQECHANTGHPGTMRSGDSLTSAFMVGKACLNCHSQVHGSNHPSGARFMR